MHLLLGHDRTFDTSADGMTSLMSKCEELVATQQPLCCDMAHFVPLTCPRSFKAYLGPYTKTVADVLTLLRGSFYGSTPAKLCVWNKTLPISFLSM